MNRLRSTLHDVNNPSLVFAADARVLVCPRCGAPEHVPLAGGETTCRFCGAVVQHLPRAVVDVHPAAPAAAFEIDRLERLRAQLDVPQPISSAVAHLAGASAISLIADARLPEALTIWGDLAARTRSGDGAAGEELVQLTNALSSTLRERDPLRVRALMETAYEAVRGVTHRNELLGMLARSACLDGDEHGAEGWLAAMDPVSFELRADSAYRSSVAVHLSWRDAHCFLEGSSRSHRLSAETPKA